eukprot:m.1246221 g.1246221  ORF g.1246221 m.1246221 type:complete len:173 (-) comp24685_c0_seq55:1415-1933(-)
MCASAPRPHSRYDTTLLCGCGLANSVSLCTVTHSRRSVSMADLSRRRRHPDATGSPPDASLVPAVLRVWVTQLVDSMRYLEQSNVAPLLSSPGIIVNTAVKSPDLSIVAQQIKEPDGNLFVAVDRLVATQDVRVRWLAPEQLRTATSASTPCACPRAPTWAFGVVRPANLRW